MNYIGIDMSKDTFHVAYDNLDVSVFENTTDGFTEFIDQLISYNCIPYETHIGVESTGTYHLPLCMYLTEHGWSIRVINPLIVSRLSKSKIRSVKTDKIDAVIIRLAVLQGEGYIFNDSLELLQLKALVSERSALVTVRAGIKQRISNEQFRVGASTGRSTSYTRVLKQLQHEIKRIEGSFSKYQQPIQQLLRSIPGIGVTSAAALTAHIGDITRFSSPKKFVAYLGLDCRVKESGTSIKGKGYITKRGNRYLRFVLFNATNIARRYIPELHIFYQKKKQEGHHHFSAMCATERKLVRIIYAVWKRGAPFQAMPPNAP